jgi:MFS transporter, ACS family, tartrate transporter
MTPPLETAVMRKVAWHLMPVLGFAYMINVLDRFNVSMAALTMNRELGLSASAYGLGAGAFFWSYVLFQLPANAALSRVGARIWLTSIMIAWGICSAGTALATGETSFVLARFLLGVTEAGLFPGVTYFMTCWFPASYRGRMMGVFYAMGAFANVLGGPLGANLLKLDGAFGVSGWQWIFLVEATPTLLLAVFAGTILCDRPAKAAWLTQDERNWLQHRLETEAATKTGHGKSLTSSIFNPVIIVLTLVYATIAYGVYSISFFLPLMIRSAGLSNTAIGYVLVLPNLCGVIGMILVSQSSDRTGERVWHTVLSIALAGIGTLFAAFLLHDIYFTIAAFCAAMFGLAAAQPTFWNLPTAFLGSAAAATGIAFTNAIGNTMGYVAPQVTGLLHDATGGYLTPMVVTAAVLLGGAAMVLVSGIRSHIPQGASGVMRDVPMAH